MGEELKEVVVLADAAPVHKGRLLGADELGQPLAQPGGQDLGEKAVVGVEEGDGAVVGGVSAAARLVQDGDGAVAEAEGGAAEAADSAVQPRQQRQEDLLVQPVKLYGDAVGTGRLAGGRALQGAPHLVHRHLRRAQLLRLLLVQAGRAIHGSQDLGLRCRADCWLGRDGRPVVGHNGGAGRGGGVEGAVGGAQGGDAVGGGGAAEAGGECGRGALVRVQPLAALCQARSGELGTDSRRVLLAPLQQLSQG